MNYRSNDPATSVQVGLSVNKDELWDASPTIQARMTRAKAKLNLASRWLSDKRLMPTGRSEVCKKKVRVDQLTRELDDFNKNAPTAGPPEMMPQNQTQQKRTCH
jgi:hypothetical protein